ncbi:hypothetical protein NBRC116602_19110 [Hyphomicrobiales bacterium 4NK60-0047b]
MKNMLDRIIAHKAKEVANAKNILPLSEIETQARAATAPRGFIKSIQKFHNEGKPALIAEIKKASPSKGLIRPDFDPAHLADAYETGGAACISVLTDIAFFQGHPQYLKEVRTASTLPVLRKDFMIDTYQVVEARAWGADCILVIMAAVDDVVAQSITNMARKWGMDVLIEVHNRQELERALKLNSVLIGINNRNLQTFDITLETTEGLAPLIPKDRIIISESGISTHDDLVRLSKIGANTFLVGETLMRKENVELATKVLLGTEAAPDFFPEVKGGDANVKDTADKSTSLPTPSQDDASVQSIDENKFNEELQQSNDTSLQAANIKIQDVELLGDNFESAIEELGALINSGSEASTAPITQKPESEIEQDATQSPIEPHEPQKAKGSPMDQSEALGKLSHVNEAGAAHMVDISEKGVTQRVATAEGFVSMQPDTLAQIQQNAMKKGDVLATARIAGIMAAKKTSDLIPLCHPLPVTGVEVDFTPVTDHQTGILVQATVKVDGKTGVEMEALTAVSVSCLTIYDMAKAIDKGMTFSGVRLIEKTGGKSGTYRAPDAAE